MCIWVPNVCMRARNNNSHICIQQDLWKLVILLPSSASQAFGFMCQSANMCQIPLTIFKFKSTITTELTHFGLNLHTIYVCTYKNLNVALFVYVCCGCALSTNKHLEQLLVCKVTSFALMELWSPKDLQIGQTYLWLEIHRIYWGRFERTQTRSALYFTAT